MANGGGRRKQAKPKKNGELVVDVAQDLFSFLGVSHLTCLVGEKRI